MTEIRPASLAELIEDYRAIEAPPGIAAAVHSQVNSMRPGNHWFIPALGALATAVGLAGVLLLTGTSPEPSTGPALTVIPTPTLGSLSRIKIEKPKNISVSLSKLRYLSLPAIPSTPKITPVEKSDSEFNQDAGNIPQQENHHVFT